MGSRYNSKEMAFRIFPINHSSTIILEALEKELERLKIQTKISTKNKNIVKKDCELFFFVNTTTETFKSKKFSPFNWWF